MAVYLGDTLISGSAFPIEPTRNIGQIIQSTVPLTDAGLHLLDGSLISGNGSYSAFVDYMANLYADVEGSGTPVYNVNIVGNVTNTDGVLSGFSSGNYATIPQINTSIVNSLEIVVKVDMNSSLTYQCILGNSNDSPSGGGFVLRTDSSVRLLYWQTTNNSSWTTSGFDTGIDLTTGVNYIKITWNGTSYTFSKSPDGTTWTTGNSVTASIFNSHIPWLGGSGTSYFLSNGSFDLNSSYININDSRWWNGVSYKLPIFCTENEWQQSVTTYGVCGKFVYDSVNNTVRLPKITGFIEGASGASSLGDLVEAGLPNIVFSTTYNFGQIVHTLTGGPSSIVTGYPYAYHDLDASNSNPIYGNSTTVQPQSVKVLYYIVIAASTKTDIEVDIDEIAMDLNGKADVDLTNCTKPHIVETYVNGISWYRVYSDGWCEQGGGVPESGADTNVSVTFLKAYKDTNYYINLTSNTTNNTFNGGQPNWVNSRTKTGFSAHIDAYGTGTHDWHACGYIN